MNKLKSAEFVNSKSCQRSIVTEPAKCNLTTHINIVQKINFARKKHMPPKNSETSQKQNLSQDPTLPTIICSTCDHLSGWNCCPEDASWNIRAVGFDGGWPRGLELSASNLERIDSFV